MALDKWEMPVLYGEGFRKFSLGPSVIADIERHRAANAGTTVMFMKMPHDLFKLTTADENVPDSPFEGGEGDVSVPV